MVKDEKVYFKMSLGIVKTNYNTRDKEDEKSSITKAQELMKLAKKEGRNCYRMKS